MKILVTGAAGYIGGVVAEQLIDAGHAVVAYDSLKSGHRSAVHPTAEFIEGNILDFNCIYRSLQGCGAVMHMASEIVVSESYVDPGLHFRTNLSGGIELLEAMRKAEVKKIVFSSSAAVYGEPSEIPITESAVTNPVSPYGESKLQFERILAWYGKIHRFKHVSLRYFNACGATELKGEDRPVETHLIPILLDVAEGKKPNIKLFGDDYPTRDGTCVRDYVHVSDIARAHVLVLEALDQLGEGTFNLGAGEGTTNLEVIRAVENVTGASIPIENAPRRQGDPAVLVASYDKIYQALGWKAEMTDIKEMVKSAWQWRKTHPNGYEE
jgi:UDP-glucose 4-epimerase